MIVYKITNTINQKKYIGITTRTLENRWIRHKSSAKKGSNSPIHRAIRKYGYEAFTIEQIAQATNTDDLKQLEQVLIQEFDTYNNCKTGYNATKGGDGTFGRIHSDLTREKIKQGLKKAKDEGRFLNEEWYKNQLIARKKQIGISFSNEHKTNISKALKGKKKNYPCGKNPVAVNQYDRIGVFIQTYKSYSAAACCVNSNSSDIMRCCQGKRKTVKGFIFKYKGN